METFRPLYDAGTLKRLRYQPIPVGALAPGPPLSSFWANGPSMLQSCGRSRPRQLAAANAGCCAPGASPLKNHQPRSKDSRIRAEGPGVWAINWLAESSAETTAAAPSARPSSPRRVIASFGFIVTSPYGHLPESLNAGVGVEIGRRTPKRAVDVRPALTPVVGPQLCRIVQNC